MERSTGRLLRNIPAGNGTADRRGGECERQPDRDARDSGAVIWDAASGARLATLAHRDEQITAVAISRDGTKIATAAGNLARLWTAEGLELRSFEGHYKQILSLAFSGDGSRLATGSEDGAAIVWESGSARRICRLLPQDASGAFTSAEPVQCVAFDPMMRLAWRQPARTEPGESGTPGPRGWWPCFTQKDAITPLPGHSNIVADVAFSADGRLVATAVGTGQREYGRSHGAGNARAARTPRRGDRSGIHG
jgi:WD40 repeat protein